MLLTNTVMKKLAFPIMCLLFTCSLQAQTKVFKEVGEDISTQIKSITQDNTLVGYLAFTRLEKADADSFNYRVTIMDENLNDIGTVNFRQENLELQAVSFEENVLCLGYVQSPLAGGESVRSRKDYKKAQDAATSSHILVQFINLNGKVINTYYREVDLKTATLTRKVIGYLKHGMQIRNIPNSGFGLFYGDDIKQNLLVFDTRGNLTHEQPVEVIADHYYLRTSASDIYLLIKNDGRALEGGYKIYVYSAKDLDAENNFDLRDGYNNWLKVLAFDNDPVTGDAFIAGCIINPKKRAAVHHAYRLFLHSLPGFIYSSIWEIRKRICMPIAVIGSMKIFLVFPADGLFADKGFYVKYATAFQGL